MKQLDDGIGYSLPLMSIQLCEKCSLDRRVAHLLLGDLQNALAIAVRVGAWLPRDGL